MIIKGIINMESQNLENCPECQKEIVSLQSGKSVCRSCGWTNIKNKPAVTNITNQSQQNEQLTKKIIPQLNPEETNNSQPKPGGLFSNQSLAPAGKLFFSVGLLIMIGGFFKFDTTVCDSSEYSYLSKCTDNLGLLNEKSNFINIGGFLFLGGCVLIIYNK
jgi:ribosomal protein L37AE/L43A